MSLTSLLLGTSFQNPWELLYKLQIEMRHWKIGSTIGIGFMAAAPLSRQWIFFLRRFQDIPCDTVAESIEIICIHKLLFPVEWSASEVFA